MAFQKFAGANKTVTNIDCYVSGCTHITQKKIVYHGWVMVNGVKEKCEWNKQGNCITYKNNDYKLIER